MLGKPKISIVIINYNKHILTKDCILSIIEQTKGVENFEIVVIDNASTEGDISFITNIDKRIKLVKNHENVGFAKGNNLGIQHSLGDVILLLNNDTILLNDAVSICYDVLNSDEKTGVVGCQLLNLDGSLQNSAEYFPSIGRLLKQSLRLHRFFDPVKLKLNYPIQSENIIDVDWIWGTFFMFKKLILKQLPGEKLPDDFFMYSEDLQWGYEFSKLGFKFKYVPLAKIYHLKGDNSFSAKMINKNMSICLRKYKGLTYQLTYFLISSCNIIATKLCKIVLNRNNI